MLQNTANPPGLFITGTDTGVGKTYVTAIIARELRAAGYRVGVYKPAASGCPSDSGTLISEDAVAIWKAAGQPADLEHVCPQRFRVPLAPHLAARAEGRQIDADLLHRGVNFWRERSDIVLVEGAGGLMSPMGDKTYVADLAAAFGYPLIVVARNNIGVINQVLQTEIAAKTFFPPLTIAGIVLNQPERANPEDISLSTNRQELAARCEPPILAEIAWNAADAPTNVSWFRVAAKKTSQAS